VKTRHDKEEGLKSIMSDREIVKENNSSCSPIVYDSIVMCKLRVPHPQALDAPFPFKKDKQRDDILETFK